MSPGRAAVLLAAALLRHSQAAAAPDGAPYSRGAFWADPQAGVERSLEEVDSEVQLTLTRLERVRKRCDPTAGACEEELQLLSSRLARLMTAESQLRVHSRGAAKYDKRVKSSQDELVELKDKLNSLHVYRKFAQLSKEKADEKAAQLKDSSKLYDQQITGAARKVARLLDELAVARREAQRA